MKSYSFAPISRTDARLLVLGSLPGQESLKQQQYYAHPRNAFWRIMGTLTGALPEFAYEKRLLKLIEHKIALWDVCKAAIRPGSLDSAITDAEPDDFHAFLRAHPHIERIAFNGGTAAQMFTRLVLPDLAPPFAAIGRETLPSTSPAHAGMPFEQKLARWRQALDVVM